MRFIYSEQKTLYYKDLIRDAVTGRRAIPAVTYSQDRVFPHLSDLTGATCTCPLEVYYNYTRNVPISHSTAIDFAIGRGFERLIAVELPPKTVDGITGTVDGICDLDQSLTEIKTTGKSLKWFKPEEQSEWIARMMGYCRMFGATMCNLVVFFKHGDYAKTRQALKVWEFEAMDQEIEENWTKLLIARDHLEDCFEMESRPHDNWIKEVLPDWKCSKPKKYCKHDILCEYLNED